MKKQIFFLISMFMVGSIWAMQDDSIMVKYRGIAEQLEQRLASAGSTATLQEIAESAKGFGSEAQCYSGSFYNRFARIARRANDQIQRLQQRDQLVESGIGMQNLTLNR